MEGDHQDIPRAGEADIGVAAEQNSDSAVEVDSSDKIEVVGEKNVVKELDTILRIDASGVRGTQAAGRNASDELEAVGMGLMTVGRHTLTGRRVVEAVNSSVVPVVHRPGAMEGGMRRQREGYRGY